jgi:hypothetical protein
MAFPSPILRCMSRLPSAALCLALAWREGALFPSASDVLSVRVRTTNLCAPSQAEQAKGPTLGSSAYRMAPTLRAVRVSGPNMCLGTRLRGDDG